MKKIDKALFTAVESDDLEKVVDLLKRGANINAKDETGSTVLFSAKDTEMVRLLLELGADVNAKDLEKNTPLILAAEHTPNIEIFRLLLKYGANVNDKNIYGFSAIKWIVDYGDFERFKLLLKAGADLKDEDLLIWGASHDSDPRIISFLLKTGINVDYQDETGRTALIQGAKHWCNPEVFDLILRAGADPNLENYRDKTALDYAIEAKNLELIKLLLEAGAEIDPNDKETMAFIVDNNLDSLVV